ncbi:hypothetical protein GVAV_001828 [Gurleya vavrai]
MLSTISRLNSEYLLSIKALYFFINLQFYTLHQFRGNFATDYFQISKQSYGTFLGILLFVTFFTNILIATGNDKFNRQRFCLISLLCISSFFFQLFYVDSYIKLFAGMFWINLLLYLMFNTSIPPLLDKITLEYLNRSPNASPRTYGRQRLFGTMGYLLANFLVEASISSKTGGTAAGKKKEYNFSGLKYYQIITTIIAASLSFFFIKASDTVQRRNDILRSWKDLIKNNAYMFFILIILLNGITRASMTMYLTIYLTDIVKLKGYSLPEGWPSFLKSTVNLINGNPLATAAFFGVILELVILYNASFITGKFGLYWPLLFAQLFQLLRFMLYFSLNHDSSHAFAFVCIFELNKGLNFGLTHICAVQIATMLCPPHLKTTSQMIYSGTFTGLASALAGFIFGTIFSKEKIQAKDINVSDKIGSFRLFYIYNIIINIVSIALFVFKYGIVDKVLTFNRQSEEINDTSNLKKEIKEKNLGSSSSESFEKDDKKNEYNKEDRKVDEEEINVK